MTPRPTTPATETRAPYHHGDLPTALRAAAIDVIAEKGVGNFSLREVARRAGVSHAAPAHHFGDTAGLLTSLAVEGFETLHREVLAAIDGVDDPVDRLTAIGGAYIDVSMRHPAHCEIMFREDLIHADTDVYLDCGHAAYGVLEDTVAELAAALNPELAVDDAAKLCWAAMQGLVLLHTNMARMDEMSGRSPASPHELAVRLTRLMVDGLRGSG